MLNTRIPTPAVTGTAPRLLPVPRGLPHASRRFWLGQAAAAAALALIAPLASANTPARSGDAAELLSLYEQLQERLATSPLGVPVVVDSTEAGGRLHGSVYAVSRQPFQVAAASLSRPGVWCEMLMLPFNTRSCTLNEQGARPTLTLDITRKNEVADSGGGHALPLAWNRSAASADYLEIGLRSAAGPFGTSDYAIELRATALPRGQTFMHFTFSLQFGAAARLATQAYLATVGRDKIGFSTVGPPGSERPVGGMRGIVERNAMRHFLAIEAWLATANVPAPARLDARLSEWFDATERYPRQLHEMGKDEYLRLKRQAAARSRSS